MQKQELSMSNLVEFTGTIDELPSVFFNKANRKSYFMNLKIDENKYVPFSIYNDEWIERIDANPNMFKRGDKISIKGELFIFSSFGKGSEFKGRIVIHNDSNHYIDVIEPVVDNVVSIKPEYQQLAVAL